MFGSTTIQQNNSVALLAALRRFAARTNGGNADAPNLQNGELLQMADYYKQHRESGFNALARIALGFFKEGDKFRAGSKFSKAHANARVPARLLPAIWSRALRMSKAIDVKDKGKTASFTPSNGLSKSFWGFMARAAFRNLQAERKRKGITPGAPKKIAPKQLPKKPIPTKPATAKKKPGRIPDIPPKKRDPIFDPLPKKKGGGIGIAILILFVLLAMGKRR